MIFLLQMSIPVLLKKNIKINKIKKVSEDLNETQVAEKTLVNWNFDNKVGSSSKSSGMFFKI